MKNSSITLRGWLLVVILISVNLSSNSEIFREPKSFTLFSSQTEPKPVSEPGLMLCADT